MSVETGDRHLAMHGRSTFSRVHRPLPLKMIGDCSTAPPHIESIVPIWTQTLRRWGPTEEQRQGSARKHVRGAAGRAHAQRQSSRTQSYHRRRRRGPCGGAKGAGGAAAAGGDARLHHKRPRRRRQLGARAAVIVRPGFLTLLMAIRCDLAEGCDGYTHGVRGLVNGLRRKCPIRIVPAHQW